MIKRLLIALAFLFWSAPSHAVCVNGETYYLVGYLESDAGVPATGKALSTVLFDIDYYDGTTASLSNQATGELEAPGWYFYTYTSNGKSGVYAMRTTGSEKPFPGAPLEVLCDNQKHKALVNSLWDESKSNHTTSGTFGYYLDAPVSAAGGSALTVTAGTGNASTWRIPIDETSTITASGQFVGRKLTCNKETREIVSTIQGSPDLIVIEPGRPFSAAPDAVSCSIE